MIRMKAWRAAVAAGLGLVAASASAHAPPEVGRIVWSPAGDRVVFVTNRGLVFKTTQSDSWSMLCDAALGTQEGEEPDVAYLPDGRLLATTRQGLRITQDSGCTWRAVAPFEGVAASALAQHPSEPNTLYSGVSGAGRSSIQESRDGGATWVQRLALADGEFVTRLLLAPTLPARIYATVELAGSAGSASSHALLRSSEENTTWKRFAIPLHAEEVRARLVAVSPRDPDLLLVLALAADRQTQPDRILVSRDGGVTFNQLWSSVGLRDAAFGADRASVWIAGDDGLWRSNEDLSEVAAVGEAQLMTCVGAHAGMLYVCGHHSGFDPVNAGVGTSTDSGQTFQRYMAFTDVMKQVTCEPDSDTALACQEPWTHWQLETLVGLGGAPIESVLGDAGMADAGSGSPGGRTTPNIDSGLAGTASQTDASSEGTAHARSGCSVSSSGATRSECLMAFGLAWATLIGRRRRPRSKAGKGP
jgi:hypothetical protein